MQWSWFLVLYFVSCVSSCMGAYPSYRVSESQEDEFSISLKMRQRKHLIRARGKDRDRD